ncbi:MAG TPA: copper chaperone [Spirochaetes bacterium]|nr:copper chaperone [Spirochaetota bacterium]
MKVTMSIEGMTCGHCVMRVKKALESVEGVLEADVRLDGGMAFLELSAKPEEGALRDAVEKAGYGAGEIT